MFEFWGLVEWLVSNSPLSACIQVNHSTNLPKSIKQTMILGKELHYKELQLATWNETLESSMENEFAEFEKEKISQMIKENKERHKKWLIGKTEELEKMNSELMSELLNN